MERENKLKNVLYLDQDSFIKEELQDELQEEFNDVSIGGGSFKGKGNGQSKRLLEKPVIQVKQQTEEKEGEVETNIDMDKLFLVCDNMDDFGHSINDIKTQEDNLPGYFENIPEDFKDYKLQGNEVKFLKYLKKKT